MDRFFLENDGEKYIITIHEHVGFIKRWLTRAKYFEEFKNLEWTYENDLDLIISEKKVFIEFKDAFNTILHFENKDLCDEIFNWMSNNNVKDPEYWERLVPKIKEKLESDKLDKIKEGIKDLNNWVKEYNSHYVDSRMGSADLSLFGYDYEEWEEGDLWENDLFDSILEKYGHELEEEYLLELINALFNSNEEYMDCKASYTIINILLEKQSLIMEKKILEVLEVGLSGYDPGHRYYEDSLLDRLIDEILPKFSLENIIEILSKADSDMLKSMRCGGDDLISLAEVALEKSPSPEQKKFLEWAIIKYNPIDIEDINKVLTELDKEENLGILKDFDFYTVLLEFDNELVKVDYKIWISLFIKYFTMGNGKKHDERLLFSLAFATNSNESLKEIGEKLNNENGVPERIEKMKFINGITNGVRYASDDKEEEFKNYKIKLIEKIMK